MYTLEQLAQDAERRRRNAGSKDADADPLEVWNTFARYAKACMMQQKGLSLATFCRFGWSVDRAYGRNKVLKPFFQFNEQFCRAFLPNDMKRGGPKGELTPFEDFNFSKAAIKFSQQLTKDQVFTGMRALVSLLGEALSEGREVDIEVGEVGRIIGRGRDMVSFHFAPDMYLLEGLEAPVAPDAIGPLDMTRRSTAPAFRAQAPQEAAGLGVAGAGAAAAAAAPRAAPAGGQDQPQPVRPPTPAAPRQNYAPAAAAAPAPLSTTNDGFEMRAASPPAHQGMAVSQSAPSLSDSAKSPLLSNQHFKREVAYKEAMDRHITELENRAVEVVKERATWSQHIRDCVDQERDEIETKRSRCKQNQNYLVEQMNWDERRRQHQRVEDIEAASAHGAPKLKSQMTASEARQHQLGQQARMREELDEQVKVNQTMKNLQKQKEMLLEVGQIEANRREMALLRNAERAKKAYDREALATAWNSDIRMKNIWKAIESHNKIGMQQQHPSAPQSPGAASVPESVPPSRAGSTMSAAGRIMTGSTRRVPIGAARSLETLQAR